MRLLRRVGWEKALTRGTSFSANLPYLDYDPGLRLFMNRDGSVGRIWRLSLIPGSFLSQEARRHISDRLANLCAILPERTVSCQFLLYSSSRIRDILARYRNASEMADPFDREMIDRRSRVIERGLGRFWEGSTFRTRRIELYFTMRSEGRGDDFLSLCSMAENILKSVGVRSSPIDAQELASLCSIFVIDRANLPAHYLPGSPLAEQLFPCGVTHLPDALEVGAARVRFVSLKASPFFTEPGLLDHLVSSEDKRNYLPCNTVTVLNFHVPSQDVEQWRYGLKSKLDFKGLALKFRQRAADDPEAVLDREATEMRLLAGERIVHASLHVGVIEDRRIIPRENLSNLHAVVAKWIGMKCPHYVEDKVAGNVFLAALPLGYDPKKAPFLGRTCRMPTQNLADLIPIYGPYESAKGDALLYLSSAHGMPVTFDLTRYIGRHTTILGDTGSGKSFLMLDLFSQYLRYRPYLWVLDKWGSLEKFCRARKGVFLQFDPNQPLVCNPFAGEIDPLRRELLVFILEKMIIKADPKESVSQIDRQVLDQALMQAHDRHHRVGQVPGKRDLWLSDIVEELRKGGYVLNGQDVGATLALKLRPFTREGPMGCFFDGDNQFDFRAPFIVFELGNLSKDVQSVLVLMIAYFYNAIVTDPEQRGVLKFFGVDEAWDLIADASSADFMKKAAKTWRKHLGVLITATQEPSDYFGSPAGLAIFSQSKNRIVLQLSEASLNRLKKEMALTPDVEEKLRNLETVPGEFSEFVFLHDNKALEVFRAIVDPIVYALGTTEPQDNKVFWEIYEKEAGEDVLAAARIFANRYPWGVH